MKLSVFGKSYIGQIRTNNEDNIYVNGLFLADSRQEYFQAGPIIRDYDVLAAVCDGIGGAVFGEIASLTAVKALKTYSENETFDALGCVDYLNNEVLSTMNELNCRNMGTTLAMIYVYGSTATAVNVGDSRIYLYRDSKIVQISKDHTRYQSMIDAGMGIEFINDDVKHQLTQNIGIPEYEFSIDPEVSEFQINHSDAILISSDGFTDVVSDNEIADILRRDISIEETVDSCFELASKHKSKDNISVVVIRVL